MAASIVLAIAAPPHADAAGYDNTQGDFLLGFREVGSTTSILADIGPISDLTSTQSFNLGNMGSLLASTYGSDWASNPNVYFSLAATNRPQDGSAPVNYVTSPAYPADGTGPTLWRRLTQTTSSILQNKIISCGNDFNAFSVQSGTNAVLEPSTSPDAYENFMPGGTTDAGHASQANIGWGYFNPTPEGNFQDGASGVVLHLIQLAPGTGSGSDVGTFTLSADGNTLTFTPPAPNDPPVITSATTATANVGTAFSYQITATNDPTSFSVQGLPSGLQVDANTGIILGTPTGPTGTKSLTLNAANSVGTGTATLTLTIKSALPVITSAATATATVGQPFSYQITATNNPTRFGAKGLLAGMSIDAQTGVITGTPTAAQAGRHTITLQAVNGGGIGTKTFTLTISPPEPVVTSAATAAAAVGQPFSYQITATNNPTKYGVGGLLAGFTINAQTGVITGTPTAAQAGRHTFTLQAANAGGTGTEALTLTISPPEPVVTSAATAAATVGQPFSYQITATNNPTKYGVGGLLAGFTINAQTGVITGTPTTAQAGTHNLTLQAANAGGTGTKTLALTISK